MTDEPITDADADVSFTFPTSAKVLREAADRLEMQFWELRKKGLGSSSVVQQMLVHAAIMRALAHLQSQIDELKSEAGR